MEGLDNVIEEMPADSIAQGSTWTIVLRDTMRDTAKAGVFVLYRTLTKHCTYERDMDTLGCHCALIHCVLSIDAHGGIASAKSTSTIGDQGTGDETIYFDATAGTLVASKTKTELHRSIEAQTAQSDQTFTIEDTRILVHG